MSFSSIRNFFSEQFVSGFEEEVFALQFKHVAVQAWSQARLVSAFPTNDTAVICNIFFINLTVPLPWKYLIL
jgi:hypothetical protein